MLRLTRHQEEQVRVRGGFPTAPGSLCILIDPFPGYQAFNSAAVRRITSPSRPAESAETLALQGLAWIAGDADLLADFMAATGVDAPRLRNNATNPEFLAAVLDFLLADEARLLKFCADAEIDPATPARVRRQLPGWDPA
jgi:hypothetical protein